MILDPSDHFVISGVFCNDTGVYIITGENKMAHWVPPQYRDRFQNNSLNRMKRPNLHELRQDVLQLLENYQNGIPLHEFGQYFIDFFGYMVDPRDYGFNFWMDMLEWFGNEISVRQFYGDFIVTLNNEEEQFEMENSHCDQKFEPGYFTTAFPIEIKQIFFQILSRHKNGLRDSLLLWEFKKATGKNLDIRNWNMYNVRELIYNLPDVFTVVHCEETGDYMLFNAQLPLPNNEPPTPRTNQEGGVSFLPRELKIKIKDVILERRGGMLLADFVRNFEGRYQEILQPSRFGLDSIEHMLESMRDSIEMIFLDDQRVLLKVLSAEQTEDALIQNLENHMQTDVDEEDPQQDSDMRTLDETLNRSRCPNDAVPPGFQIQKQTLPVGHDIRKYMAVYVSYITSPSVFWFQLRGKSTSLELDNLMDDINNFYNNEGGELYSVPPERITNKQLLAVRDPEDGHWYRAVITATEGGSAEVEVNFIDYGSRCKVPPTELRLLRNIYCDLPAQALEAELAFISPREGHVWAPAATEKFQELTKNGSAIMALINEKKCLSYSLCLCDTTSDADIHINDVLLKEGYAKLQEKPRALNFAMQPVGQENHGMISPPMITLSDNDGNDEDDDDVIIESVHVRTTYVDQLKHETISICGSSSNEGRFSPQDKKDLWSMWR